MREPHITDDGARVAVTGVVFDELAGAPRTAIYAGEESELQPVSTTCGSARWARFAPDGAALAFLIIEVDAAPRTTVDTSATDVTCLQWI